MMQEHCWQARGVGPLSVWEFVQNLNAGSYDINFEARHNSMLKKYFEARLNDHKQSGNFDSFPGL
jgi:hypothetical protein